MDKKKFKEVRNLIPMNPLQAKVYKNPNNDPKGRWRPVPMTAQAGHATKDQFYPITAPGGKNNTNKRSKSNKNNKNKIYRIT